MRGPEIRTWPRVASKKRATSAMNSAVAPSQGSFPFRPNWPRRPMAHMERISDMALARGLGRLAAEIGAGLRRRQAEVARHRGRDVGIGAPASHRAQPRPPPTASTGTCSRVRIAPPGRVAAMIGGHDEQVVRPQRPAAPGQAPVEALERIGVARHVAAMAELGIEVDVVGKQQPPSGRRVGGPRACGRTARRCRGPSPPRPCRDGRRCPPSCRRRRPPGPPRWHARAGSALAAAPNNVGPRCAGSSPRPRRRTAAR